jgi:MSHA biogenesis protein MshJ
MKQITFYWKKLSARIDALTLRERALLFAMAAGLIVFTVFFFFLNPAYSGQKTLLMTMGAQQDNIAGVEAEITQTIIAHSTDPDAADRARLQRLRDEAQALKASLTAMQEGMVPAERMSGMLERILRAHSSLKLKSMRTLREGEGEAAVLAPAAGNSPPGAALPPALLHKHGVEVVVQGSFPALVAYLEALEGMQGQIFWDKASLTTQSYPQSTLTLVVYTVNFDKNWVKL